MNRSLTLKDKKQLVLNSDIELGEQEGNGKGRYFMSRFIEPGIAHYEELGDILITKETLNKFIQTMVGVPVIIDHEDVTDKNVDKLRVGSVSKVWFNEFDGYFYCEGILTDPEAIDLVKNQGWNVSCAYSFQSVPKDTHNGKKIDMEFIDGEFLHLAIVKNPRYEGANIVVNKNDEKGKWITVRGTHIFIPEGQDPKAVIETKFRGEERYYARKELKEQEEKEKSEDKYDSSKYTTFKEAREDIEKKGEMKKQEVETKQQIKEAKENNIEKLTEKLDSEHFGKWANVDDPADAIKLKDYENKIDDIERKAYKNYNGNTPPAENIYSNIQSMFNKTSVYRSEKESKDYKEKIEKIKKKIKDVLEKAKDYNKFEQGKGWVKNNIGDITMQVLNDLTDFIKKVVKNEKEEEMTKEVKNEDKRKLIDEIGGILKDKVDDEIIRTVIKKAEELSYEPSEDSKADNEDDKEKEAKNKCKNEDDEKDEKVTENEEKEEKKEDKKEEADNEDEEEKKEDKKEVKNSMKDIVMGGNGQAQEQKLYVSRKERLEEGNKY